MKAKPLKSDRLIYEPLSINHLSSTYVNWLNDSDVNKYLETRGGYNLDDLRSFLKEQEEKDILFWAIRLKSNNKHIGNIKIDPIDTALMSGEYGILMGDKNEWGKGYAKEASLRIIQFCFKELHLAQITLGVIEKNTTALTLYKKIGFKVEKIIEDKGIYDGEMCNAVRMILKND